MNTFESIIQPDTSVYMPMSVWKWTFLVFLNLSSILVNIYGLHEMNLQAVELFRRISPELTIAATYICVLNACSQSSLVNEVQAMFSTIKNITESFLSLWIWIFLGWWFQLFILYLKKRRKLVDVYESCHSPSLSMLSELYSIFENKSRVADGLSGVTIRCSE